ncbi:MAG: DUF6249 domain-containing protein [Bacteroidota bacterium]
MNDLLSMVFLFIIPVIAIIGGITMGIIRTVGQQRMAELARRERIAAIERGIDPDKLPPQASPEGYDVYGVGNGRLRRAHGLMISGSILIAVGLGLFVLLKVMQPNDANWVVGSIPLFVGLALMFSSRVVWPKK